MGQELVTSHSSGYETSLEKLIISYLLSDQLSWCNIKWFVSYSKNYIFKFMQAYSWHHKIIPLPFVLLSLEIVERKGKN